MIARILNPIALRFIWPAQPVANLYIWMVVFGIVCALLCVWFERTIIITATAMGGSFLFILSIGGLAGHFPNMDAFTMNMKAIPWQWWAYFGGWIASFLVAMLVQCLVTSKFRDHKSDGGEYQRL